MPIAIALVVYLAGALVTARMIRVQFHLESITAVLLWPLAWVLWSLIILPVITSAWFAKRLARK